MKSKINQLLLLAAIIVTFTLYIQSCKNDTVTEPPPPEEPKTNVPALVSPHNESSSQILTPTLDWEDFANAESYMLQISLDANFQGIMLLDTSGITISQMQMQSGRLVTNTYYYWRVRATGSTIGTTGWSSIWRFNVIMEAPDPPVLISPLNGATNQSYTPLLDWAAVPLAQYYRVQLSPYSNFTTILYDSANMTATEVVVPLFILNSSTTYFWRVNASNSNGISTSQWANPWNFTTLNGPPPNSISGHINFIDTNSTQGLMILYLGIYNSWPPVGPPNRQDTLQITQGTNGYEANYTASRIRNGSYYITVVSQSGLFLTPPVLGIYGCDTVHLQYSSCPTNPTQVVINNNIGVANINFISWADSLQRIY